MYNPALLFVLATTALAAPQFGGGGGGSNTANDLVNGVCKGVTLIFARGTGEGGNMGSVVGPPLATELKSRLNNDVAVQGVDYPADIAGVFTGQTQPAATAGSKKMAELLATAASKCPNSKVVLSGYSQGAQQVHGALINSPSNKVFAAVTFGDPLSKQAFKNIDASKTKVFCNEGDSVCQGTFFITPAHLTYGSTSVKPAADFIVAALGA